MFTDDTVRELLVVGRQVTVGKVVAGQALVAGDPGAFKDREREVEAVPCGSRWELNRWQR